MLRGLSFGNSLMNLIIVHHFLSIDKDTEEDFDIEVQGMKHKTLVILCPVVILLLLCN